METKEEIQKNLGELKARETKQLEDGSYTGTIQDIYRDVEYYDYMRYRIAVDEQKILLDANYPSDITILPDGKPSSSHAKLLNRFGIELEKDKDYKKDIMNLINRKVKFVVVNKTNDKGTFANIERDSVKPL